MKRNEVNDLELGLWRLFLRTRLIGLFLLGSVALIPAIGVDRRIGLFTILVGIPFVLGELGILVRTRRVPWMTPAIDAALLAVAISLDPQIAPVVGLILMGSNSQSAMVGWRSTFLSGLIGLPFLAVALFRYSPANATVLLIAYVITSASTTIFVSIIAGSERRERRSRDQLLQGLDAIVWEANPYPFEQIRVRGRTLDVIGISAEALSLPGAWLERLPALDRARVSAMSRAAIDNGDDHEINFRVVNTSGEIRHIRDRVRVETDESGRPIRARGVAVDITEEVRVGETNRSLAELVERVPVGLIVARHDKVTGEFTTVTVNPAYEQMTRRGAVDLVNASVVDPLDEPGRSEIAAIMKRTVETGLGGRVDEAANLLPDETRVLTLESFLISHDLVGVSLTDVTDSVAASQAIRHRALHDGLTGLPNRALFEDRLAHALETSHRTDRRVALLVLDLDQFKEVNDTFGHAHGDHLLVEVSRRLKLALRSCDTVARLGGDEFALLLSEDVTRQSAVSAAERVMDCFDRPIDLAGMAVQCGASIGLAFHPDDTGEVLSLQQRADAAMYVAKQRGGGISIYEHHHGHDQHERLGIVGELGRAIDDDQLVVHYQPLINLATNQVDRVEALVRWDHPTRGLISPANFIDVAEVSGIIRPLTRYVMRRAINDVSDFRRAGHEIGLALNISVRNLYEPSFVNSVRDTLAAANLPGSNVTLEITETQVMDDPILAHDVLGRLGSMGVKGSVDDFGTGHSSLSNLQSLPVNEIKIDRSFVLGMATGDDASATIVRSIVALGHNLGLDVVAEGIETQQMLDRLVELECDRAQGFHLAHPMSRANLSSYLDSLRVPSEA